MTIYITDQGQIFGEHPDYPFPKKYSLTSEAETINARIHAILFDDQERVMEFLPHQSFSDPGIYTVGLPEVERVEQFYARGAWHSWEVPTGTNGKEVEDLRTVFRFVERKEDKVEIVVIGGKEERVVARPMPTKVSPSESQEEQPVIFDDFLREVYKGLRQKKNPIDIALDLQDRYEIIRKP